MYEVALDEAWELFGAHLSGTRSALVMVLHKAVLDEASRAALSSSAAALGYGREGCLFVALDADDGALDPQALFLLIEGIDPRCLVAADAEAAKVLQAAYRCEVALGEPSRLLGRTAVAFSSFSTMLADGQDKQVAWALLKKLPRHGER